MNSQPTDSHRFSVDREDQGSALTGEIDLRRVIGILWASKFLLTGCVILATLIGGFYAFRIAEPKYRASARLMLEVRDQQVVDVESVISGVSADMAAINSELAVITSRRLIGQVIDRLNLIEDTEFNPLLAEQPTFSISALRGWVKGLITGPAEDSTPSDEELRMVMINAVTGAISVNAPRNTYLFDISATSGDPRKAALLANTMAEVYLEDQIAVKFEATDFAISWLSERVTELELEMDQKQDALKQLRAQSDLVSAEALAALNIRVKESRDRLEEANRLIDGEAQNLARLQSYVGERDLQTAADELNDPFLNRILTAFPPGADRDAAFADRLDTMLADARAAGQNARDRMPLLEESYRQLQEKIARQTEELAKIVQQEREVAATQVLYDTFLARLKETSIQVGLHLADSRILSEAVRGNIVQPRKSRILVVSFVLGLMGGLGIVFLQQIMISGFRTASELEGRLKVPVLAEIPQIAGRLRRQKLLDHLVNRPTSAVSEAIRNLRTSVLMSNVDNPPQVIMSTSSLPAESKTTHAISLATNLAGLNKRVLLVECDIRRRTFDQYFGKNVSGLGLVSAITREASLEESVHHVENPAIDVLFGQKSAANAADLFASDAFARLVQEMRDSYDYVILDTPPCLVVPDARVIGRLSDAIIYAVRWNATDREAVVEGVRQLQSVGLKVTGLVLAQINVRRMRNYGYGYGYGKYYRQYGAYYDT